MRYRVEHLASGRPEPPFEQFIVRDAECVPRVGEHVTVERVTYIVIAVFHEPFKLPLVRLGGG